jgi:molecular chaperone DnaK
MPFHKVIGIDLGTTYSAVSIWDGKEVRIIESAFGLNTVPSVVGLDSDGGVIVGTPAQNNLISDPTNTVIEVKRKMGTYETEPAAPTPVCPSGSRSAAATTCRRRSPRSS